MISIKNITITAAIMIFVCIGLGTAHAVQKHSKPSDQNTKCTDNPADDQQDPEHTECKSSESDVECDEDDSSNQHSHKTKPCSAGGTVTSPQKEYYRTEVLEDIYCVSGEDNVCCEEKTDQPCVYKYYFHCHNSDVQKNCPEGGTVTVQVCNTNSNTDPDIPNEERTFAKTAACPPE